MMTDDEFDPLPAGMMRARRQAQYPTHYADGTRYLYSAMFVTLTQRETDRDRAVIARIGGNDIRRAAYARTMTVDHPWAIAHEGIAGIVAVDPRGYANAEPYTHAYFHPGPQDCRDYAQYHARAYGITESENRALFGDR